MRRVTPPWWFRSSHKMRERNAIALCRNVNTHHITQRWKNINVLSELVNHCSVRVCMPRVAHNSYNVLTSFPVSKFLFQTMITEKFSMVGHNDNDRVLPLPSRLKKIPHTSELRIHFAHHAKVLSAHVRQFIHIRRCFCAVQLQHHFVERWNRFGACNWLTNIVWRIHRTKVPRC